MKGTRTTPTDLLAVRVDGGSMDENFKFGFVGEFEAIK